MYEQFKLCLRPDNPINRLEANFTQVKILIQNVKIYILTSVLLNKYLVGSWHS